MVRTRLAAVSLAGLGWAAAVPAGADDVAPPPLAAHRAVYDLDLVQASERSGIEAMYGRMVYEFTGAACKGYTTRFRFVTRIDTGEELRVSDQQMTSVENAGEGTFRFESRSYTDETLDKHVAGVATRVGEQVKVDLTSPEPRDVELAASVFPTAHMQEVIAGAIAGRTLFDTRVFDGSENGDKSLLVTTIIGKPVTQEDPDEADSDADKAGDLAGKPWWPVTASYFNDGPEGDAEPVYRLSFKLYDNGASRDLVMDYGEFTLSGKLSAFQFLPEESCE